MADRDDYNWAALGEAIRARRRQLGILTQTAAAARSGIDLNTWNRAERGQQVGARALTAISEVLGWEPGTPNEILTRVDAAPLAVIPLSTSMGVSGAILRALAVAWERETGQTLMAGDMCTEPTPWGQAFVVRDPRTTEETGDA